MSMPEPTWWNGEEPDTDARPCRYETFSGECLHCGAQIGEGCVWELEQIRERRERMGFNK